MSSNLSIHQVPGQATPFAFNINALPHQTQSNKLQALMAKVQSLAAPIFAALGLICIAGAICSALFIASPVVGFIAAFGLAIVSVNLLSNSLKIYRSPPISTDLEYRSEVREKVIDAFKNNQGFGKIANAFAVGTFEEAQRDKLTMDSVISHNDIDFLLTDDVLQLTFDRFLEKHGENVFKYLNKSNLSQIIQKFIAWMTAELLAQSKTLPEILELIKKCDFLSLETPELKEVARSFIRENKKDYIENSEHDSLQFIEKFLSLDESAKVNLRDLKDEYARQKTLLDQAVETINFKFQESKIDLEDEMAIAAVEIAKTHQKLEEDCVKAEDELKKLRLARLTYSCASIRNRREEDRAKLDETEKEIVFSSVRKQQADELYSGSRIRYPELITALERDHRDICEQYDYMMNQEILEENEKFEKIASVLEASLLEILQ